MRPELKEKMDRAFWRDRLRKIGLAISFVVLAAIFSSAWIFFKFEPTVKKEHLAKTATVAFFRSEAVPGGGKEFANIQLKKKNGTIVPIRLSDFIWHLEVGQEVQYIEKIGKYTGRKTYYLIPDKTKPKPKFRN